MHVMSQSRWAVLCALLLGVLWAVGWHYKGFFMPSYTVVDPDVLFQLVPGAPRRAREAPHDPQYFDNYGYLVAGETRAAVVLSSKRQELKSLYDVDLTFHVWVSSTDWTASKVFAQAWEKTHKLTRSLQVIDVPSITKAEEAKVWRTSQAPGSADCIAQVRYGNYVLLFVGRIEQGGYFENERQFLDMVRALDTRIPSILERAT
jgi:hypothetical protein